MSTHRCRRVKLAMAIIGICSIHLLKTFIEAGPIGLAGPRISTDEVMWQTAIRVVFILSTIGIARTDRLMQDALVASKRRAEVH